METLPHEGLETFDFTFEGFSKRFDEKLLENVNHQEVTKYQAIPALLEGDELTILTALPNNHATLDFYRFRFQVQKIKQIVITDLDIFLIVERYYKEAALYQALFDLSTFNPNFSASYVFTKRQVIVLALAFYLMLVVLFFYPVTCLIISYSIMQIIYISAITFRFALSVAGIRNEMRELITDEEVNSLDNNSLPIYTVLIPVYKEPQVVPILIQSLKALDYPHHKLDVLLLMEESDKETISAAREAQPPPNWRFVILPESLPKTKPKACSYGLQFSRGEYLTIFDGEDIPAPDQLKKALIGHRRLGPQCLCVQAALNYFNSRENFITALFTLEYCYWFDYLLPGLDYFKLPIPLGGTSNHFNVQNLRDLGGWDPYNTTEDADLGLRAFSLDYSVGVINSTTLEEANSKWWNFIRQRSRWLKGYMQTALVYNRSPIRMIRQIGIKNWICFQLLITFTPLMLLINPIIWCVFIFWVLGFEDYMINLSLPLITLGLFNLFIGNFIGVYLNMLGVFKRKEFSLLPYALLNPFYWLFFHSVAAYKGLWQLFANPFYWEKTDHGISSIKPPGQAT